MHGDGLTRRRVPWPILLAGELVIDWVVAVGRRYRCPDCRGVTTVSHPGLRDGATYGTVVIAALLYIIADRPLGWGWDEEAAYELARGRPLSAGERARTGRPRWWSIRRWLRDLDDLWGPVGAGSVRQRIHAVVAGFGVGRPLHEVLDRIPHAHAHGGLAM